MTDPLPEVLRAAARADVQGDFDDVLARAARRRVGLIASVALGLVLVLVGAGVAAVQAGDGPEAERLVESPPTLQPTTTASATPASTATAAPTAAQTTRPPDPRATPTPTVTTAAVVPPATRFPRYPAAVVVSGGHALDGRVSYTVTVDRSEALTGDRVVVTGVLANGSSGLVTAVSCGVLAQTSTGPGGGTAGRLTGLLKTFHDRASSQPMILGVSAAGGPACRGKQIAPGEALVLTQPWAAQSVNDSAYDGMVQLQGEASYRSAGASLRAAGRGNLAPPDPTLLEVQSGPVALSLGGGNPRRLSPLQAVERALAAKDFAQAVETTDPDACEGVDSIFDKSRVSFDASAGYTIGACTKASYSGYSSFIVGVNATSGAVSKGSGVSGNA